MDTINHQVSNNPDDDNMKEVAYASNVAEDILNNIETKFDFERWSTLSRDELAEAFVDLTGIYAAFKNDAVLTRLENRSELLEEMATYMHNFLFEAAKREGYAP
jgi:hypothetical protein